MKLFSFLAGIAAALVLTLSSSSTAYGQETADRNGVGSFLCPKTCNFPLHSSPKCRHVSPCGFTCIDGYTPFPISFPVKCVCNWPYTECNGRCAIVKACPSKAHYRRDLTAAEANCPVGHTACGILGRATGSWECVNTQRDLESCGGCLVSATNKFGPREGQDCTAIEGVSDVSCVQGTCVVRKCMPGYEVDNTGGMSTCKAVERKKETVFSIAEDILAAEYGA